MKDSASNLNLVAKRTLTVDKNNKIKVVEVQRYIVTIYVAAPGTPLVDKDLKSTGTSLPGHLYYSIFDFAPNSKSHSFGFAPINHGSMIGPGKIYDTDEIFYVNPYYSRTMEISKKQYDALMAFGKNAAHYGFSMEYAHAKNNCVDFVWNALNHVGLKSTLYYAQGMNLFSTYEGDLKPINNVDAIKSIKAPFEKSNLNKEKNNPMPKDRNWKQKLLSENTDEKNQYKHS